MVFSIMTFVAKDFFVILSFIENAPWEEEMKSEARGKFPPLESVN
jgi:hypothetical protein